MIILIKRIISFAVVILIGVLFYKKFIKGENIIFGRRKPGKKFGGDVEKMDKDPVCGTYVPEKNSLKLKSEGEFYHFCSEKCRNEYIALLKK